MEGMQNTDGIQESKVDSDPKSLFVLFGTNPRPDPEVLSSSFPKAKFSLEPAGSSPE